jgi:Flp pilus assembly protein TadB
MRLSQKSDAAKRAIRHHSFIEEPFSSYLLASLLSFLLINCLAWFWFSPLWSAFLLAALILLGSLESSMSDKI